MLGLLTAFVFRHVRFKSWFHITGVILKTEKN